MTAQRKNQARPLGLGATALALIVCGCQTAAPPPNAPPGKTSAPHHHNEHGSSRSEGKSSDNRLCQPSAELARVIPHAGLRSFENQGNTLTGIATHSLGACELEVWRASIAPHSETPLHTHESEEIFVILKGEGVAIIGGKELPFAAPATLIAPAGVPHQVRNTGEQPTDHIVIVRAHSSIYGADRRTLDLPWRR